MKTICISGADRGLGYELVVKMLDLGHRVIAGRYSKEPTPLRDLESGYPERLFVVDLDVSDAQSVARAVDSMQAFTDCIDVLINNAGILTDCGDILEGLDLSAALTAFVVNSMGPLRMVEACLPLMQDGLRRLCFVSSEAGSIAVCMRDRGPFGYCMSKTALNMAVRLLHNRLAGQGYGIRLYHPGWLKTYMHGYKDNSADIEADISAAAAAQYFLADLNVEERLEMVDYRGVAWPF